MSPLRLVFWILVAVMLWAAAFAILAAIDTEPGRRNCPLPNGGLEYCKP